MRWSFPLWLFGASLGLTRVNGGADLEAGRLFLQNFELRDYHAHNQNWAAAQDARDVMYFGNKEVVLEYDGVSWRKLPVPGTTYIRGLAFDPATNAVFVGAVDELGYLRLEPDGERTFVSLLEHLPSEARDFRDIRRVFRTATGDIVFVADEQVMRWSGGKFTVLHPGSHAKLTSFLVDGRVFLHSADLGLLRLDNDQLVPVASTAACLRADTVTVLLPGRRAGELLVGTQEHGFWRVATDGTTAPSDTGVDTFLQKNKLRRGGWLADGTLVFTISNNGLV